MGLFMVVHKHMAEMCLEGIIHNHPEFATELDECLKESGVKCIEGYLNGPSHEFRFVIETDGTAKLWTALIQLLGRGNNQIVPVLTSSDAVKLAKKTASKRKGGDTKISTYIAPGKWTQKGIENLWTKDELTLFGLPSLSQREAMRE